MFVGIAYFSKKVLGKDPIMLHGNATIIASLTRQYIRTCKETLRKSDELLSKGLTVRKVYDSLTSISGGSLHAQSQGLEPRNIKQIRNRKASFDKFFLTRKDR